MKSVIALSLLAATCAVFAACSIDQGSATGKTTTAPPALATDTSTEAVRPHEVGRLTINSPGQDARIGSPTVEVTGTGADPDGLLEVSVFTNEWFVQDGFGRIQPDGSFRYSPVHISGRGIFNNHAISVNVVKGGQRTAGATVSGIVRLD